MLSSSEIVRGTEGSFKLLTRDPAALYYFDNTFEACLRSFRVMALAAPLYAVWLLLRYSFEVESQADEIEIIFVEALHYVVDWLLFPVIFYEIARRRGWLERYPRYIIALNWVSLPAIALMVLGKAVGLLVPPIGDALEFVMQILLFYWFLAVTRAAMQLSWPISILLLVVNSVPSFFLTIIVDRFLGVTAMAP